MAAATSEAAALVGFKFLLLSKRTDPGSAASRHSPVKTRDGD